MFMKEFFENFGQGLLISKCEIGNDKIVNEKLTRKW